MLQKAASAAFCRSDVVASVAIDFRLPIRA
jgi:hypothetical protein